jgi:aryl-alcohol dehydrogenase-like predicted oxidoreductase
LNYSESEVACAANAIESISGKKRNKAQTAIQFVLKNPAVTSAIVGIRTMGQLQDAIQAVNQPAITEKEYGMLRDAVPVNFYEQHR